MVFFMPRMHGLFGSRMYLFEIYFLLNIHFISGFSEMRRKFFLPRMHGLFFEKFFIKILFQIRESVASTKINPWLSPKITQA
jgi:hypothetical protein